MKKFIIIILSFLMFSCSKDSTDSNNSSSGTISWSCKVNGVQYQWSGSYPYSATRGQSSYLGEPASTPTIMLASPIISSGNRQIMLTLSFQNENLGSHLINGSVAGNQASLVLNQQVYSTYPSTAQINLNISQMASAVNGITKGTFSGTMVGAVSGTLQTINITDGSFEVIRIQ
ncbi:MAG: hypothetical protein ACOYBS_11220 [Flavobacterium sp.]